MMWHDWGWGGWLVGGVGMVAFWAVVVWAIVMLVRQPDTKSVAGPAPARPEDILAERFARGEIDADEYARRRDVLRTR